MRKIFFILLIISLFTPVFGVFASSPSVPVKILLVPGHDAEVWGAQYGNIKEADMNLQVATQIYNILKKDKNFNVHITRDKDGYTREFAEYFTNQKDQIISFKENAKQNTRQEIASGNYIEKENVPHVNASPDMALKLYGINKWANDNNIDAVIHIHFNDYPRPNAWKIGKHKGYAIYFPDIEFGNSKKSLELASFINVQLSKKYQTSTYEKEKNGLIADQNLIAMGANNTLNSSTRSVLVEYGYIYEKKFRNSKTRHQAYKDMAGLTASAIKKYFTKN